MSFETLDHTLIYKKINRLTDFNRVHGLMVVLIIILHIHNLEIVTQVRLTLSLDLKR